MSVHCELLAAGLLWRRDKSGLVKQETVIEVKFYLYLRHPKTKI